MQAVLVGVVPDAVANGAGRVCVWIGADGRRNPVVAEVGGQVLNAGRKGHGCLVVQRAGGGFCREVLVIGGLETRGRRHHDLILTSRHAGEQVAAVGVGVGRRHDRVAVLQLDLEVGDARLAGIRDAVAVLVQPDPVADHAGVVAGIGAGI